MKLVSQGCVEIAKSFVQDRSHSHFRFKKGFEVLFCITEYM